MPEPVLVQNARPAPPLRVVSAPADADAGGKASPAECRLEVPPYDLAAARALEDELGISHVLAQILVRRGLGEPGAARAFLEADEEHPPEAFDRIGHATAAVERMIATGGKITVHGDYDVDGVCATAILVRALGELGAQVDWFLPHRLSDGYGLSTATVQRLAERGTQLLVTADCAITAVEAVAEATALGMQVVVTDHHHPRPDGLVPECPIVHPVLCGYPCPDLCGAAVAHKLALGLGARSAGADIELVALATVADLMPLRGENRRLVRQGLEALGRTARPGLRALMDVARADPSALDASVLGFRLAPRINASGRLQRADAGLELLLTEDPARAAEIAGELDGVNSERRAVEQRILWEAEAQVGEVGERPAFVLAGEGWHPGVIGIVASRIAERYHRPAVLIALDNHPSCQGSARSIAGFDLLGALHACSASLERYGGHRAAAGLTIRRERIEEFRSAFEAHARNVITPEMGSPVERVDAIVSGSELGLALVEELDLLEPTGVGNPGPRLLVPGARLRDGRAMGEGRHLRFTVSAGGTRSPAVAFGCDGRLPSAPNEPVNATFRLERNSWKGMVAPRLVLRRSWSCAPDPIEVIGEPNRYLSGVLDELGRAPGAGSGDHRANASDERRTSAAAEHRMSASAEHRMSAAAEPGRTVLDRRGESPLAVLADALAAGGPVLAVCADVSRRLDGLMTRIGGFSLVAFHALERAPEVAERFVHIVGLDPPSSQEQSRLIALGSGWTHLAWGEPELRFAQQMHELEYGLRASLVALYRALRDRRRVAGEELERLLRGEGPHGRPARLAGRLIRVLAELELVSLDPGLLALAIAGEAPTALDLSPSYRVYAKRYEDGRQFLSRSANLPPSA